MEKPHKSRFKRGLKRYLSKNYSYGWKAVHRRIRYRNMLWERAPVSFIMTVVGITFFVILTEIFQVDVHPIVLFLLLCAYIILTLLEIWYIGVP